MSNILEISRAESERNNLNLQIHWIFFGTHFQLKSGNVDGEQVARRLNHKAIVERVHSKSRMIQFMSQQFQRTQKLQTLEKLYSLRRQARDSIQIDSCIEELQNHTMQYYKQSLKKYQYYFLLKNSNIEKFKKGIYVIYKGMIGYKFYVIIKGSVKVIFSDKQHYEKLMYEGQKLGIQALLSPLSKRTASVICLEDSIFFSISKEVFNQVLLKIQNIDWTQTVKFFNGLNLFKQLSTDKLRKMNGKIIHRPYYKNQIILEAGSENKKLYFIFKGQVSVQNEQQKSPYKGLKLVKYQRKIRYLVSLIGKGEMFGNQPKLVTNTYRCHSYYAQIFQIQKEVEINYQVLIQTIPELNQLLTFYISLQARKQIRKRSLNNLKSVENFKYHLNSMNKDVNSRTQNYRNNFNQNLSMMELKPIMILKPVTTHKFDRVKHMMKIAQRKHKKFYSSSYFTQILKKFNLDQLENMV